MTFADNIKNLRISYGLTQEEFGKIAGVNSRSVSKWELGQGMPRPKAVALISDYFRIDHNVLLGNEDDEVKPADVYYDMVFHSRPEIKDLFDEAIKSSPEDVEKAMKLLKDLK